ncbi:MAG TPA: hypothetical protein VNR86_06100 [Sphingomicrobium sp.]|nr:hypothetical protein [Sphingomicrobium sp.]
MLLDLVGVFFLLGYAATIIHVMMVRAEQLHALAPVSAGIAGWLLGGGALAGAAINLDLPVPLNVILFAFSLSVFGLTWILAPAFRQAAAGTRVEFLIALNAWRLGGFFFLLLYSYGRLGWPFAPVAAVGDMITGAIAAVFLLRTANGAPLNRQAVAAWNIYGLIDLLVAVSLAFLSTAGAPFQLFTDVPAHPAFAGLPWLLVPSAIVPALMFVHFAIALNLRARRASFGREPAGAER